MPYFGSIHHNHLNEITNRKRLWNQKGRVPEWHLRINRKWLPNPMAGLQTIPHIGENLTAFHPVLLIVFGSSFWENWRPLPPLGSSIDSKWSTNKLTFRCTLICFSSQSKWFVAICVQTAIQRMGCPAHNAIAITVLFAQHRWAWQDTCSCLNTGRAHQKLPRPLFATECGSGSNSFFPNRCCAGRWDRRWEPSKHVLLDLAYSTWPCRSSI